MLKYNHSEKFFNRAFKFLVAILIFFLNKEM